MKKRLFIICIIFLLLFSGLGGCTIKPIIEGTGTIVFNDFEGGFYGIIADNGFGPFNKLDPINLPPEFMEDGLRVRFKAKLRPDLYSFHMWGIMAEILEIERLDYRK